MKSRMLSKQLKAEIVANAITSLFGKQEAELGKERLALGDALYHLVYSAKEIAYMTNAPKESAFVKCSSVKASFGEERSQYYLMSVERPFFYAHQNNWKGIEFSAGSPAADLIGVFDQKQRDFDAQKKALRVSLNAVLNSVATTKQLVEAWPGAVDYLPQEQAKEYLPALPIGDLTEMIERLKEAA